MSCPWGKEVILIPNIVEGSCLQACLVGLWLWPACDIVNFYQVIILISTKLSADLFENIPSLVVPTL